MIFRDRKVQAMGSALALALLVGALAACDASSQANGTVSRSSPTGIASKSVISSRDTEADDLSEDPAGCLARQRRFVVDIGLRLQHLVAQALSHPEGALNMSEPFATAVHDADELSQAAVPEWKTPACDHPPVALAPLLALSNGMGARVPDRHLLRVTIEAFDKWAADVGRAREVPIVFAASPCAFVSSRVGATYTVRYATDPNGGKEGWVDLILNNRSRFDVYVEHGGQMLVEGLGAKGLTRRLPWGGSSADGAVADAGRTSRTMVYPVWGPGPKLPLQPWGSIRVLEFGASLYAGRLAPCGVDVTPGE